VRATLPVNDAHFRAVTRAPPAALVARRPLESERPAICMHVGACSACMYACMARIPLESERPVAVAALATAAARLPAPLMGHQLAICGTGSQAGSQAGGQAGGQAGSQAGPREGDGSLMGPKGGERREGGLGTLAAAEVSL